MFVVNKENRTIEITNKTKELKIIKEFENLDRIFLESTSDKYKCELVLLDIGLLDEDMNPTGIIETQAFSRRVGFNEWLMPFVEEEYNL